MNIIIIYNNSKDVDSKNLNLLLSFLNSKKIKYIINPNILLKENNNCHLIIALGGDGTVMHGCKYALQYNIPIIGINIGKLGFLTQLNMGNLNLLERLFNKDYIVDERIIIEATLKGNKYYAINDVVIARSEFVRLVDLDLYCNNQKVLPYRADGLIIATPTGSTAYSLAAGGPIVEYSVAGIVVTPISSHSLNARSIIFNKDKCLKVISKSNFSLKVSIDGNVITDIGEDDIVEIKVPNKTCKFINLSAMHYLKIFDVPI